MIGEAAFFCQFWPIQLKINDLRKIIHIDMDAFFASVEQRDFPELRGKPVAVGGAGRRGVVAAASYEARKFGVRSAMPGSVARRLCPELIFTKSRFEVYGQVSRQIREIFLEYTDLVEPLSLDEAYLDVTDAKIGPPSATILAEEIRRRIFEKTGLTASAGVSFNKFLAKQASDINKPNGIKIITPADADEFLENLAIEKFHGIGKATAERMKKHSIFNGRDLKNRSEMELAQLFGKMGRFFFRIVRADDPRSVRPDRIRKSLGAERTFDGDISDLKEMFHRLEPIAAEVFRRLERADNFGKTLTVKIKTADFQQFTRARSFSNWLLTEAEIFETACDILENYVAEIDGELAVRLLGITLSNLQKDQPLPIGGVQLRLF